MTSGLRRGVRSGDITAPRRGDEPLDHPQLIGEDLKVLACPLGQEPHVASARFRGDRRDRPVQRLDLPLERREITVPAGVCDE